MIEEITDEAESSMSESHGNSSEQNFSKPPVTPMNEAKNEDAENLRSFQTLKDDPEAIRYNFITFFF